MDIRQRGRSRSTSRARSRQNSQLWDEDANAEDLRSLTATSLAGGFDPDSSECIGHASAESDLTVYEVSDLDIFNTFQQCVWVVTLKRGCSQYIFANTATQDAWGCSHDQIKAMDLEKNESESVKRKNDMLFNLIQVGGGRGIRCVLRCRVSFHSRCFCCGASWSPMPQADLMYVLRLLRIRTGLLCKPYFPQDAPSPSKFWRGRCDCCLTASHRRSYVFVLQSKRCWLKVCDYVPHAVSCNWCHGRSVIERFTRFRPPGATPCP